MSHDTEHKWHMYIHRISITIHILLSTPLPFSWAGWLSSILSVRYSGTNCFFLKTVKNLIFAFFEVYDNP